MSAIEAARALLARMPNVSEKEWTKEMQRIWKMHPVMGALGALHVLQFIQKRHPRSEFLQCQMQACREAVLLGAKLRHGYMQYGMEPWDVVHHKPAKPLARYKSEPYIKRGF